MAVGIYAVIFGLASGSALAEDAVAWHPAVLVELFTSEGCSSCPPADALLAALDRREATSGVDAIVLSEHVDYWNHDGWSDPFSSPAYSERQVAYAKRLRLDDVYTPQMVVDGASAFVGSDAHHARAAIQRAAQAQKATVHIEPLGDTRGPLLRVQVEIDRLPSSTGKTQADVYFAVAQNEATSQVLAGENGGRRLHHVAVVRSLKLIGRMNRGTSFREELPVNLGKGTSPSQMRFVAFVQEHGQGRVLGAAMQTAVSPGSQQARAYAGSTLATVTAIRHLARPSVTPCSY